MIVEGLIILVVVIWTIVGGFVSIPYMLIRAVERAVRRARSRSIWQIIRKERGIS